MNKFLKKLFNIEGKVAAITGGGGYICGEMARGLAKCGCKVAVMDIREEKSLTVVDQIRNKIGGEAESVKLDATDKNSFFAALEKTLSVFGKVDVLINGAGINSPTPFFDIEIEEFHSIINSQLTSTFFGCQVFGEYMISQKKGSIINISSASAGPPLSKAFSYSIAKSGIVNLTQNLGREWGETGVRVNAIRPGFFPTEWNLKNFITEEREAAILGHTPMARFGKVEELVGAAVYLSSDAASFVTGSEISVDGGFSCMTI